jgi:hypothetical protein
MREDIPAQDNVMIKDFELNYLVQRFGLSRERTMYIFERLGNSGGGLVSYLMERNSEDHLTKEATL